VKFFVMQESQFARGGYAARHGKYDVRNEHPRCKV
jgi:hypothetical protein